MIDREVVGEVAVLRMVHGKANAFDLEFAEALAQRLWDEARSDQRAVVVTGVGGIFSAGVDLVRLMEGGPPYVARFLAALRTFIHTLLDHPKPMVAAINGHAIAGGCVMACACDYRIMSEGKGRVGVPELRVGVPFPTAAIEAIRLVTPAHRLQDTVYGGRTYPVEQALARGLVDEVVPEAGLLDRALERAREMARIPSESFRLTKQQLRAPALAAVRAAEEDGTEAQVDGAWAGDEALAAVRDYVRKTLGK